jgi:hypothetical protein
MQDPNDQLDKDPEADPYNLDYIIPDGLRSNVSLQEYSDSNHDMFNFDTTSTISDHKIVSELQESLYSSFKSNRLSEVFTNQQFSKLTTSKQVEILRELIPTFKSSWSLFPVFFWPKSPEFSITYQLYFQVYRLAILKCFIFLGLALILWFIQGFVGQNTDEFFWVSFGTPFLGFGLVKLFEMKTERIILNDANKEEQGWTQNRFALMFENLDVKGSKQQFKAFLEMILMEKRIDGKIIDIMFLQDCRDYGRVREKYFNVENSWRIQQKLSDSLLGVHNDYQKKKALYEKFALYRGKAIVIFETIAMQREVYNHFQYSWFKSFTFSCCCCCCCCINTKLYKFIQKFPTVSKLPEPEDMAYENLHHSKKWIYSVELIVYSIGLAMVGGGIVAIIILKVNSLNDQPIPHILTSGLCVTINACLNFFGDLLFANMIRKKKSSLDYERLTFFKRLNFLNFNVYFCVLMVISGQIELFIEDILITSCLLIFSIPIVKVITVTAKGLIRRFKLNRLRSQKEILTKYTKEEICQIISKQHFDFPSSVGDLSTYMFICSGFYFVAQVPLVLLAMASLILNIIVDKWLILNYTAPVQIMSPNQGLNYFSLLKWDIRVALLPLGFAFFLFGMNNNSTQAVYVFMFIFFGISMVLPLSVNLQEKWKSDWADSRKFVKYGEVAGKFKDTFQKRYPIDVY